MNIVGSSLSTGRGRCPRAAGIPASWRVLGHTDPLRQRQGAQLESFPQSGREILMLVYEDRSIESQTWAGVKREGGREVVKRRET